MKKNSEILSLLFLILSAFIVVLAIFNSLFVISPSVYDNFEDTMGIAVIFLCTVLISSYALFLTKRLSPKEKIFISYSQDDKEVANKFLVALDRGFSKYSRRRYSFLTADSVSYGCSIPDTILDFIIDSDYIIVLLSSSYMKASNVETELLTALKADVPIIPVLLEPISSIDEFPEALSNLKSLSLYGLDSTDSFDNQVLLLTKDLSRRTFK